jgi:hypothetical protein
VKSGWEISRMKNTTGIRIEISEMMATTLMFFIKGW